MPAWTQEHGTPFEFDDGALLRARVSDGVTVVEANVAGLRSLARLLITLAAVDVPAGTHVHLDEFAGLEPGTSELIVERVEKR